MKLDDFLAVVRSKDPADLAEECLYREFVHAIQDESVYKSYIDRIKDDYPSAEQIAIMGSGNWKFSLNPMKKFSSYHSKSDIDIAIICGMSFEKAWEELRRYHRENYYLLPFADRKTLKRNGENIYSGFVSPLWIPKKSKEKHSYLLNCNKYSDSVVGYRSVNMMYFKNRTEVIDYYKRGFLTAQQGI